MPAPRKFVDPNKKSNKKSPSVQERTGVALATSSRSTERPQLPGEQPASLRQYQKNRREALRDDWGNFSTRTMQWVLEGDRLETMLAETRLKDIAVVLGISTEKVLLMEGQPTQIIASHQQQQLDQVGKTLQEVLKQRGLVKQITMTERKAEIELNGTGTA